MGKFLETAVAMACVKSMLMVFNFVFWVGIINLHGVFFFIAITETM